jgi:hypothetical protein
MPGGPRPIVDPPLFTPNPYGLLTAVQMPPPGDPHWLGGVTYEVRVQNPPALTAYDECIAVTGTGISPAPPMPTFPAGNASKFFRGASSFEVYAEFDCSSVDGATALAEAELALSRSESWQVERSFWTGIAAAQSVVHPHLASNAQLNDPGGGLTTKVLETAATVVSGGALFNMTEAIGALEGMLATQYGGIGVIHVPEYAGTSLDAYGLIRERGGGLTTLAGNKVALGAGYPGTSPAGAVPPLDQVWIYGTGAVMMRRTDVVVRAGRDDQGAKIYDRSEGTFKAIAERTYCLGWDYGHVAVLAALGAPKGT